MIHPVAAASGAGKPKLLDQVRQLLRLKHYSSRTEETYLAWMKRKLVLRNFGARCEQNIAPDEAEKTGTDEKRNQGVKIGEEGAKQCSAEDGKRSPVGDVLIWGAVAVATLLPGPLRGAFEEAPTEVMHEKFEASGVGLHVLAPEPSASTNRRLTCARRSWVRVPD